MMNTVKWLQKTVIFLCVLFFAAYFLVQPVVIRKIEPVLAEAGADRINGTLSWGEIHLDPLYNLEFTDVKLMDSKNRVVFTSPSLQVDWTIAGAFSAWKNGNDVSAMIQNVVVDRPEIHALQEEDGQWNVQTLLKPQEEETPNHFRGRILLKKGLAEVSLQTAGQFLIKNMEGQFSWLNAGSISAVLSGEFSDAHFDAKISYEDEQHFSAEASMDDLSVLALQPFLSYLPASAPAVSFTDGTVEIHKAEVRQDSGNLTYSIAGHLGKAALAVDGWDVKDASADFTVTDGKANMTGLSVLVNGQQVTGNMDVSWFASPEVQGELELHQADLAQLLPDEDLAGEVSGTVYVSGPISDWTALTVDSNLALRNGELRGLQVSDGEMHLSAQNGLLSLSSLEVRTEDGLLKGMGTYDLRSGNFEVHTTADQFSLAPLKEQWGIDGMVSGALYAAGSWDGETVTIADVTGAVKGQNLSYGEYSAGEVSADFSGSEEYGSIRFYGDDLSAAEIVVDTVSGEVSGGKDNWMIPWLAGTMGEGAFSLRGTFEQGQISLAVQAGNIDVAPFAEVAGQDVGGKAAVDGVISGTLDSPLFDAAVTVMDGHYRNMRFHKLSGRFASDGEWLTIAEAEMEAETGRHSLSGRVGLTGAHPLELSEKSELTRIEDILQLVDVRAPLTGWIQNESEIGGTVEALEITGHFMAWDGSAAGELYQSISADYALQDGGQLQIANGLAYIYGGTAVVNGTVSEQSLDLETALIDVDLERILRKGPAKGRITFRGHVSGTMTTPVFDGGVTSRRISVSGAEIEQISADLSYADNVFRITDGAFRQRNGQFRWSGVVNAETEAIDGRLQFSGWGIREALRFFQLPVNEISGEMNGGMLLHGTLDNPNVSLNVNIIGGRLGSTDIGDGRLNLSYLNGTLTVQECYLPIGRGSLAVKGTMEKDGQLQFDASAEQMDVDWLPQVLGLDNLTLGGELSSQISLTGRLEDPSADIVVRVDQPKYNEIAFDELVLTADAGQGVLRIHELAAAKGVYKASAHGDVPISAFTRVPGERDVPFNVDVDLDNADLNALVFMADSVTSASGPIQGHITISGPWNDPVIQGGAVVRDGRLTLNLLSEPVTAIHGSLLFAGKQAELTGEASVGGGAISAAIRTAWDQSQLSGYAGELHAHLPNLKSLYYNGKLDADMLLSEERGLPKISGTVVAEDAVVDIPLSLASSGSSPDILTDIEVTVGDDVRLYNSLLYDLFLRGNVHIAGLLSAPATAGRVNVERGTIKYLANEFVVTEGYAVWGGIPESLLPMLNLRANTTVGHYKIGMDLQGPPGGFIFRLRSEPALNDTQIVTLLTLRQAPGTSADDDNTTGALFNAGLSMAFSGGVQDLIRNTFGLDFISVTSTLTDYYSSSTSGLNNDYYYVKIGKYLFNDFMLTATMGVNNEEKSYGFRYDLKSRIGIVAWYNNDHDSYVGADYQFRF